jgi:hypothetical protein
MHNSYEIRLKHRADFGVKYKFRNEEDGGRKHLPYQGLRCDFSYHDGQIDKIYMIWPEFEDETGKIILEDNVPVPKEGTALMWIVSPERRIIHQNLIKTGLKCFFWEGKVTADCEVIELIDLFKNPVGWPAKN